MSAHYNPKRIRRCVREIASCEELHGFKTKSFTRTDREYFPAVNLETGSMECQCGDWLYRKSRTNTPCKHLAAALRNLARKGVLPKTTPAPAPEFGRRLTTNE